MMKTQPAQSARHIDLVALLAEIVSDATGVPAVLVKPDTQLDADLGLRYDDLADLQIATEFELGISIDGTGWFQNADCVGSLSLFLEGQIATHADANDPIENDAQGVFEFLAA